ncbi:MAG: hypothetical protein ABW000_07750 [Actinoplanes sp.]
MWERPASGIPIRDVVPRRLAGDLLPPLDAERSQYAEETGIFQQHTGAPDRETYFKKVYARGDADRRCYGPVAHPLKADSIRDVFNRNVVRRLRQEPPPLPHRLVLRHQDPAHARSPGLDGHCRHRRGACHPGRLPLTTSRGEFT